MTVTRDIGRRRASDRRWGAAVIASLLVVFSLLLAWQAERQAGQERSRQVEVQARILAGSIAGALAFDDRDTAREYLDALAINQDIQAAGIYGAEGDLIAGYVKRGPALPRRVAAHQARIDGEALSVVQPVAQGSLRLGDVFVRATVEPWTSRASRYFGIGTIIVLAALLIAALGASYVTATASNRRLQQEIAAREQAEFHLRQAQKMEAIGQLTGGVAHDFNNMLMAASSGLALLDRAKDDERREKLKRGIREALDRGAKLTQQLLTFARRAPLQKETIDLERRIEGLSDLLERSLREDIDVRYDLEAGVWPVEVDPSQFDVALLNIAVNARDAMPKGGTITITARNEADGLDGADAVRLSIRDSGSGMTAEQIERAFEPFFTTKGVGRGTGLGLSQVYGFARGAGGTAEISSREGSGTVVSITLPRAEGAVTIDEPDPSPGSREASLTLRVLLVEDDDAVAGLVMEMLEELGCTVTRSPTADDASRTFERAEVDAVLSDMVMPGSRDGLDLAREFKTRWPELPVLLMSGYSAAATSAAREGFGVLGKPFSLDDLSSKLADLIQSHRDR